MIDPCMCSGPQEGTSSDYEDNDSAVSCSPTPEREMAKEDVLASFSRSELKAKHPSQSTSYLNLFNIFSSTSSLAKAGVFRRKR